MARQDFLQELARRTMVEELVLDREPAEFEITGGGVAHGLATVRISRASIAIRFVPDEPLEVVRAAYGQVNGAIHATSGLWRANRVNFVSSSDDGEKLFVTQDLLVEGNGAGPIAATRLVLAGARLEGETALGGARVVAAPLTDMAANHHDARMALAFAGEVSDALLQTAGRATSFVAGLDVEPLRIDHVAADGSWIRTQHSRGFRKVGRAPHSPLTGTPDEARLAAWSAVANALASGTRPDMPLLQIVNMITASNQVGDIDSGGVLLALATRIGAYHLGRAVDAAVVPSAHRDELAALDHALALGLTAADFERYENLRVELFDSGFFHKPGYETGRPQNDIKFLRDIAHLMVFRLCGYEGDYYRSEAFAIAATGPGPRLS
ncbi:hypothetical protein H7F51_15890 [Novosphingobium flavum]|uniref:Uncharacterized protein n=1 Tax=Novosphingobium flavum TaxID=1778672 RepID=A0A7X1FUC7_9SPHN|nr:hypothetical protein [Novosphingobium flavum]MBC2666999.1 hypothetical protein [Novosphingobium flavum]